MKRLLLASLCALTACSSSTSGSGGGGANCAVTGCPTGYSCNTTTGACAADGTCVDASCPAGNWCDHYTQQCSSAPYCTSATDCPPSWSCGGSNRCVDPLAATCTDLRDCPAGRLCQPSTGTCVQAITCSASSPCPAGTECVSGLCARLPAGECRRQGDCFTAGDRCVSDRCVGCQTTGAACTGALEACDAATNTCRVCTSNAECSPGLVCTADGCAECASDLDCAAAYPNRPTCVKQAGVGEASAAGRCQECTWAGANTCSVGGCTYGGEYCAPSGICAVDGDCSGATPHCVPPLPGGNPYCGRCAIDAHCPAGQGCRNGECHVFPPGDRCGEPMALGTLGARTDFVVSLAAYGWETNDGSWDGHDAFYRFTLTEESTLTIDGRSALSWASGRFRLFGEACAGRVGEHYFGNQVYNPPYSTYYPAWTVHLPAGTWVLAVGGYADPEYAVSIQKTPVTLAEGLGCATPTPIVQSASGSSVTGTTDALLSTSGDSCASERWYTPARTAVYSLDLAQPSYVALAATPLDAALLLDLDVKDDCRAEAPRDVGTCNADAGVAVTRTFAPMPAGLHYVVVDAEKNTNGSYRLDAVVTPWSMNDLCADAKPLTFDAGGVANETGTIAVNTSTPSAPSAFCGGLGGNDVFYAFTTTADQRLDVQVQGDGTWKPGVSVRPACGATSGPVCAPAPDTASAAVASVDILPAGTWLVQVASPTGAAGGPFTLQVGLSAPVYPFQGNDTCATATALTAGTTVSGDTRGVTDDLSGVCGATVTGAGKDLAYVFTAPSRGSFEFRVMPGATFQPVLRTMDACPGTAQLACGVASAPGANTWLPPVFLQANESVYAWVDGYQGSAGAFTLNPIFLEAPANDLCAGATVIGSTWNAINLNVPGSVATAFTDGTCAGAEGPDVFFKMLVPNGRWNVTVTVDPTSYFQPAVAYYGSCGTACAASAVAPAPGANAVLGSVSLNGSGYFGVSSVDGGRGSFNLIVTFL